jgi:hypothetical protein
MAASTARAPRRSRTPAQTTPPDAPGADTLGKLLAPVTPGAFVSEYCGRRALLIKGRPEKVQQLVPGGFTRADFFRGAIQGASQPSSRCEVFANRSTGFGRDSEATPGLPIAPEDAEAAFAGGSSISVHYIGDARLAAAAAALKTELRHPGDAAVAATLSPRGFGFPLHLDRGEVFFVQCEGRKRFRISEEPAVVLPGGTINFDPNGAVQRYEWDAEPWEECDRVDVSKLREVVLEPGDVLYVPAGGIHGTCAVDDESLTALLLLDHVSFLDLVTRVLKTSLAADPNWRHLPRAGRSAPLGALAPEVVDFFAARLAEFRAVLDDLSPDSLALNREWHRMLADPGEGVTASLEPAPTEADSRPVRRGDRLRLSRRTPLTYARGTDADGDEQCFLYYGDGEVNADGEWAPFLATLVEQDQFRAATATGWAGAGKKYAWDGVQEYLQVLLEQGIVERVR